MATDGVEPPTFHFSGERCYQLSYLAVATPTGLEPATSAVTGRRANQLRYRALVVLVLLRILRAEERFPGPGDPDET